MNKKIVSVILLVLMMSFAFAMTPSKVALGQGPAFGLSILQITRANETVAQQSTTSATVGSQMNLQGTQYSSNGPFQVTFNGQVVASGNAVGYYVNANFTVPELISASYSIVLRDVTLNENSADVAFKVETAYLVTPASTQLQEGSSVLLNVGVTGGTTGEVYSANVSVELPSPLNTNYTQLVSIGSLNSKGTATTQITFPSSNFQPSSSSVSATAYSGVYNVYFNMSVLSGTALGQSVFFVGFLDSTQYHRGQIVTVRAISYTSGQTATLTVTSAANGNTVDSQSVTASSDGIISATWTIPSNVAVGDYTITIAPQGSKALEDVETFSVIGYPIQIKTVNLAGEAVPYIGIQAAEQATSLSYNITTGADGTVGIKLELGNYVVTTFWRGVNVGVSNITVTGSGGSFTVQCRLTDLSIEVQNENGVSLPFINLAINYPYGNVSGQTDASGFFKLNSTLTGISYTVDASLYGRVFNSGNDLFNNIATQPSDTIVVTCPNETLAITVVGNNQEAITDARIEMVEITNGLFYTATTDSSGSMANQVSFGMYRIKIYKDNILINQTSIQVFGSTQQQIRCTLYGIQVSIKIVDFFQNPISNVNVTLNGPETEHFSAMTKGDGTVVFSNVVGGNMQVVAFPQGAQKDYQALALSVSQPTSVQVQMAKYIAFGSMLVPVSLLIAVIVVAIAVVLLAIVEIYRRRRVKRTLEPTKT